MHNPIAGSSQVQIVDPIPAEVLVGLRVRQIRHARGLSLRALSEQSSLNINTLSMIENGKSSPSVTTLQLLSQALNVPIATFFEHEPQKQKVIYVQKCQRPKTVLQDSLLENLGKDLAGNALQPFMVHLKPGAGSGRRPIVHTGHEFVYCIQGEIQYTVEQQQYPLLPGDTLLFESNLPHHWKNPGNEDACILLIFVPSDQRDEPSQVHFKEKNNV